VRIEILKTGQPTADIESAFGSYPGMIRAALGPAYRYHEVDVLNGDLPGAASEPTAYVITGSASSAYHDDAWIGRLRDWLRDLDPAAPLVGICFGHQIMAHAYGGVVRKASKGWAMGLHEYDVVSQQAWMDDTNSFVIPVSHYDQVVRPPSAARVIAASDFCPYAALSYRDRRAVSFQGHPEFSLDFTATLIDRRLRRGVIDAAQAQQAKSSMQRPDDRGRVLNWIRSFLNSVEE
jgi:GMP synthase-like glutamine amidotransferase